MAAYAGTVWAQTPQADVVAAPRFDIERFDVTGNTLLKQGEIDAAVAAYVGKQKDFSDIQRALETLEQVYRDRGYGVVQVLLPEQDITRGVVRLRVIEPKIGKVVIEGNKYFNDTNVRNSLPGLKPGATPNSQKLAQNLQLLAEHPAKQTTVLLRAGETESLVDATVKVTDENPLKFVATLDNSGTDDTGRFRTGIAMQHSNVFNRDHVATLQYVTNPENPSKVQIYGVGYRIPFYDKYSSLEFFAGYSDVNSGTLQGLFNVAGSGTIMGARYNFYLPKIGEYEHKLALGVDYRAFQNQVNPIGGAGTIVPDVTILPLSIAYNGLWRMSNSESRLLSHVLGQRSRHERRRRQQLQGRAHGCDGELQDSPRGRDLQPDFAGRLAISRRLQRTVHDRCAHTRRAIRVWRSRLGARLQRARSRQRQRLFRQRRNLHA